MDRINSEGIQRWRLSIALTDRHQVLNARKADMCLLCRRHRVNEAGLCDVCYSGLEGDEFRLASRWLSGVGPP